MPSQIALLGAAHSGRHALLRALTPRLGGTGFDAQVIDDLGELRVPSLVLLLAPRDAAGEAEDLRWREQLTNAGIGYSVLHGDEAAQADSAWRLIQPLLGQAPDPAPAASAASRWVWSCDKCSDPACEHRLFQDLVQGRRGA